MQGMGSTLASRPFDWDPHRWRRKRLCLVPRDIVTVTSCHNVVSPSITITISAQTLTRHPNKRKFLS